MVCAVYDHTLKGNVRNDNKHIHYTQSYSVPVYTSIQKTNPDREWLNMTCAVYDQTIKVSWLQADI